MNTMDADIVDVAIFQGGVTFTTYFADREPIDGKLTVVDLTPSSCRWPSGNPARSQDVPLLRRAGKWRPLLRTPGPGTRLPAATAASRLTRSGGDGGRQSDRARAGLRATPWSAAVSLGLCGIPRFPSVQGQVRSAAGGVWGRSHAAALLRVSALGVREPGPRSKIK